MAPGAELLAAPWALQATPLQFPRPTESFSAGSTLSFDFQSSRNATTAETRTTKAIRGQLLSIRSRIATVTHAATTSVAQIEFAANQKRHEVTKLDDNEGDESIEIRLCSALGKQPPTFPSPLIVVFMLLNENGLL